MDFEVFKLVVVYSLFGMGVFGLAFVVMVRLAPFSLRKEIEEDQNTAVGIVLASVILGLAHIIASVVHG